MRIAALLSSLALLGGASCKTKPVGPAPDAAVVVAGAVVAEEVEPNDSVEQATLVTSGQPIRGRLFRPGARRDIDHYKLVSREPRGILRAEVGGVPGLDLALSVVQVSPRKSLAHANNGRAGAGEVVPNVGVTKGEYVVVVRPAGRRARPVDAPYTLTVTLSPAADSDELEPNDSRLDAQAIEPARAIQGYFGRRRDVDWYKLTLPATQGDFVLRVEMTAVPGVRGATLEVLDEIEVTLKKAHSGRGTGVLFPNLWVQPRQQTLYVVARGGPRFNPTERYTLQTTLQQLTGPAEREPNDRHPQATLVAEGQRVKGYLAPAGDVDWFALEAPRPSIARIAVTGVDHVDLVLSLHDEAGKPIVSVDEGRAREGEVLPNVWLPAGRSLVRLSAKKRQENVFATYELTLERTDDRGDEEREPNDTPSRANPIRPGAVRRGMIYPRKDVDVYRLDVPGPGPRRVRVQVQGIPKVPLALRITEASGAELVRSGPKLPQESQAVEKELLPGTYYLEVSGGGVSNPRDRYEIRVSGT